MCGTIFRREDDKYELMIFKLFDFRKSYLYQICLVFKFARSHSHNKFRRYITFLTYFLTRPSQLMYRKWKRDILSAIVCSDCGVITYTHKF